MTAATLRLGVSRDTLTGLAGPLLTVMILTMMVLPLPPWLLDLLFTFNIALSIIVMLVAMHTLRPLDFAVFPTVLLLTTLLRLSLNVASTRVVLMHGHSGPAAAGKVIEAFGNFLVGGNFAVGFIVFVILIIINFIVITKGAGRIAEVSARFTLDAMPGKQMAIDADLNAGLIGEDEARRRRTEIAEESDFFGSMDGASKFVRGDAIAGVLILLTNIVGGLAIGMFQHGMPFTAAIHNYVLLSIGDGLVAQIPALVISTAAGLVVSRVGRGEHTGQQLLTQVFRHPQALVIVAFILGMLGIIPGMPHLAFLLFAAIIGGGAWWQMQRKREAEAPLPAPAVATADAPDVTWDDLVPIDVLGLEVGYRLITLVDKGQDGELLRRIKAIRRKFAQEIGFLPPAVHIHDNLELAPTAYRITLKGVTIASGESHVGMYLAINPGHVSGTLPGIETRDPAFGLAAQWIDAAVRDQAQAFGYTVVDAGTVIATHLSTVMHGQAGLLLGRRETQHLLDQFGRSAPKLVEDLTPKLLTVSGIHRVLQNLLDEGVSIRDMTTILETLIDHAARTQEPDELTAAVRVALGPAIVQQICGPVAQLDVIALDPELERVLQQMTEAQGRDSVGIEPGLADTLLREVAAAVARQEAQGLPAVLLVPDRLRLPLARLLRRSAGSLKVLGHSEIPEARTIRISVLAGGRK
ncbi:MAG TPA: flagellar biosynthesis protein FlhA [Burkholderiales bacterium]|jgi:flagellar biosynthesis protein FlhA|nr:flagellar biosynthesis protein FlhA [Burkholderiales bacterium]